MFVYQTSTKKYWASLLQKQSSFLGEQILWFTEKKSHTKKFWYTSVFQYSNFHTGSKVDGFTSIALFKNKMMLIAYPNPLIISSSSSFPILTLRSERIWPSAASRLMVSFTEASLIVYAFLRAWSSSPMLSYCLRRRVYIIRTNSGSWIWSSWDQRTIVWDMSSFSVAEIIKYKKYYQLLQTQKFKNIHCSKVSGNNRQ